EDEHVIAAGERAPDHLLGVAPPVEGSGVDPVDAAVHRGLDGPYRVGVLLRSPVDPPLSRARADGSRADAEERDQEVARARRRRSMTVSNAVRLARMPILRPEEETKVREWFGALARPVELFVALGPEETPRAGSGDVDFGAEM